MTSSCCATFSAAWAPDTVLIASTPTFCVKMSGLLQPVRILLRREVWAAATWQGRNLPDFSYTTILASSTTCKRFISMSMPRHKHSRSRHVPYSQRERSKLRPSESFQSVSGTTPLTERTEKSHPRIPQETSPYTGTPDSAIIEAA